MSNNISKIIDGYNPLDFEKKLASFLRSLFENLTIQDPVDKNNKMKINIYESEFPERDVTKLNKLSPYCLAQFVKETYTEEGCIFLGRIIISTYGQNTSINRQDNQVIGSHIVNKLITNPNGALNPFRVLVKGKYKITYELVEQQPTSLFVFGFVQFYCLAFTAMNNALEEFAKILGGS